MRSRGPPVNRATRWEQMKKDDIYGMYNDNHTTQGDSPMAKKWPSQDVPQSGQALPAGMIQFKIEDLEPTESNSGKFMIKASFRAQKPKEVKNMPHTEYFVIGSDDDPSADDPDTWKQTTGSKRFKTMLVRSQTKLVDDVAKQCKVAVGQEFLSSVTQETEEEGQYKGTVRARLRGFFEVGSRKPELEDAAEEEEEAKSKSKTKAKAAAKDDDDEDEDEEEEEQPKKGAKSKKSAKDEDDEEEEEEEESEEEEEDEDEEEEEEDEEDDEDEKPKGKKAASKKRPTKKTTKK